MKKRRHSNVDRLRLHKKNHFSLAEKRRRSSSFASPFDAFSSINTLKCVSEHLFINCVLKINQENSDNIIMDERGKLKEPPALSASRLLVPSNIMDNWNQHKTLFGDKIKMLGNNFDNRQGFLKKFSLYLQVFYERSRLRYFIPIIILLAYSFLGGIIFYTIESPAERVALLEKEEYMNKEENKVLDVIMEIEDELKYFFIKAKNITVYYYYLHEYRKFAMNKLNQRIYWYALESYYLSDQEAFKSSLLHPTKPEPHWSGYFKKPYGQIYALKNYTEQLSLRCWEICAELTGKEKAKIKLKEALKLFHQWTGLEHILSPTFTFRNSMFLAVTTYTTIGYGNITPKTNKGRFAVMIYAIVGIPLVLMILHKLGRYILLALEYTWDMTIYAMEAVGGLKNGEKYKSKILDEERDSGIPVLVAMFVAFGWMFMCAAAFLFFEKDWDYFKSFYFFFCSLTTIGYGDVVPTSSDDMFIIFFFIIIGLSLVSMCINVVQLKLEQLVEEILLAMMEEYTGDLEFGFSGANLKARLGIVDMWKIWKRRRSRKKKEKVAKSKDIVVKDVKHGIEKKTSFVNKNFREMMPFGKRRRVDEIMQEIQKRLVQKNMSVQTDPVIIYRIDEKPFENKVSFVNKSVGSSSLSLNKKPELESVSKNLDELPIKYKRDITYRHNQTEHEIRRRPVLPPSYGIQYPINEEGYQYTPTRRWTFVETGKAPKGAPRGLAAHYMYNDQQYPHSDELEYLVQEIDTRLKECRKKLIEKQKAEALKNRRNTQTSETDE
uniref:Potassium channel subfamily K member 18 (inferred by orthology to a human protein) n=1 Tax=Strongyloides venezuelensis TaxID=75913 RepID=A0A0K0FMM1_STRVS